MRVRTAPWTPRWAAGALVAAVLVAGCSDPDQPGTVPRTTPPSTTMSQSPSPTSTEAQVEAAVRAYYAELNRALQTNNVSKLKQLVDKNCPCYNAVKVIERNATENERTPNASFKLQSVRVHDIAGKTAAAEVEYTVTAYDVLDANDHVVTHIKKQRSHFDLSLILGDSGWILANLFDLEG
ncbi:MAG: DUF6318 family protein [Sporichthyaceae bacterium]